MPLQTTKKQSRRGADFEGSEYNFKGDIYDKDTATIIDKGLFSVVVIGAILDEMGGKYDKDTNDGHAVKVDGVIDWGNKDFDQQDQGRTDRIKAFAKVVFRYLAPHIGQYGWVSNYRVMNEAIRMYLECGVKKAIQSGDIGDIPPIVFTIYQEEIKKSQKGVAKEERLTFESFVRELRDNISDMTVGEILYPFYTEFYNNKRMANDVGILRSGDPREDGATPRERRYSFGLASLQKRSDWIGDIFNYTLGKHVDSLNGKINLTPPRHNFKYFYDDVAGKVKTFSPLKAIPGEFASEVWTSNRIKSMVNYFVSLLGGELDGMGTLVDGDEYPANNTVDVAEDFMRPIRVGLGDETLRDLFVTYKMNAENHKVREPSNALVKTDWVLVHKYLFPGVIADEIRDKFSANGPSGIYPSRINRRGEAILFTNELGRMALIPTDDAGIRKRDITAKARGGAEREYRNVYISASYTGELSDITSSDILQPKDEYFDVTITAPGGVPSFENVRNSFDADAKEIPVEPEMAVPEEDDSFDVIGMSSMRFIRDVFKDKTIVSTSVARTPFRGGVVDVILANVESEVKGLPVQDVLLVEYREDMFAEGNDIYTKLRVYHRPENGGVFATNPLYVSTVTDEVLHRKMHGVSVVNGIVDESILGRYGIAVRDVYIHRVCVNDEDSMETDTFYLDYPFPLVSFAFTEYNKGVGLFLNTSEGNEGTLVLASFDADEEYGEMISTDNVRMSDHMAVPGNFDNSMTRLSPFISDDGTIRLNCIMGGTDGKLKVMDINPVELKGKDYNIKIPGTDEDVPFHTAFERHHISRGFGIKNSWNQRLEFIYAYTEGFEKGAYNTNFFVGSADNVRMIHTTEGFVPVSALSEDVLFGSKDKVYQDYLRKMSIELMGTFGMCSEALSRPVVLNETGRLFLTKSPMMRTETDDYTGDRQDMVNAIIHLEEDGGRQYQLNITADAISLESYLLPDGRTYWRDTFVKSLTGMKRLNSMMYAMTSDEGIAIDRETDSGVSRRVISRDVFDDYGQVPNSPCVVTRFLTDGEMVEVHMYPNTSLWFVYEKGMEFHYDGDNASRVIFAGIGKISEMADMGEREIVRVIPDTDKSDINVMRGIFCDTCKTFSSMQRVDDYTRAVVLPVVEKECPECHSATANSVVEVIVRPIQKSEVEVIEEEPEPEPEPEPEDEEIYDKRLPYPAGTYVMVDEEKKAIILPFEMEPFRRDKYGNYAYVVYVGENIRRNDGYTFVSKDRMRVIPPEIDYRLSLPAGTVVNTPDGMAVVVPFETSPFYANEGARVTFVNPSNNKNAQFGGWHYRAPSLTPVEDMEEYRKELEKYSDFEYGVDGAGGLGALFG